MSKRNNRLVRKGQHGPKNAEIIIGLAKDAGTRIKFGAVTIAAAQLDQTAAQSNVEKGQRALARVAKKFCQPGVSIRAARDVPLYSVDEMQPGRLIRKLNGKIERGVLENGHFKAVNEFSLAVPLIAL